MSNCIIDNGYTLGCASIGGVEKLWIGTWSSDATYTMDADSVITGVTSGSTVYLLEQDMEFCGLNQNGVFTRENGSVHYESILSAKFTNLDADLRNTILALGKAPVVAVVKSNAGLHYIAGVETAGRATAGVSSLGVAMSDLNGATLEFTFKSANGIYLIDGALLGTSIPVGA
jgi:hypothetical protein